MTTVLVLSDTHGNRGGIQGLFPLMRECDRIIHLGDTSGDGAFIRSLFPRKTHVLNGNCDPVQLGEDEAVIEIEGVKIFACHGHRYSVKTGTDRLCARAASLGCGVALYGHTHRAEESEKDGVLIINPGSLSRYSEKSYCYLVINKDKAVPKIVYPDERNV